MLQETRQGHVEWRGQLSHTRFARRQARDYGAPRGVRERLKAAIKLLGIWGEKLSHSPN
jgi:hypothetical protein